MVFWHFFMIFFSFFFKKLKISEEFFAKKVLINFKKYINLRIYKILI